MRIIIDGDATPNIDEIADLAQTYFMEMIVYCDYAHEIEDERFKTITNDIGKDSVDRAIINGLQEGDLLVTQDYGLASLALMKKAIVLHVTGKKISQDNIDNLLMSRYLGHVALQQGSRHKGPHKRTRKDKDNLLKQIELLLIDYRF
ncbi:MAG: DUF188 domain-containing protein [Thomasclavelia sp.]|jgi:uncharacterized protein YaiI (UPF0178 family)|nr:DUF188 domain-containing protein [Thomasclavelia sp.]